jgi:hypothetical protein
MAKFHCVSQLNGRVKRYFIAFVDENRKGELVPNEPVFIEAYKKFTMEAPTGATYVSAILDTGEKSPEGRIQYYIIGFVKE